MEIKQMHKKGLFISEIARITGHDRKTVRKLINLNGPPKPAKRRRAGKLDPFKDYLKQRLGEGCSNAALLFEELQAMGFTGRDRIVRKFVEPYRPLIKAKATLRYETAPGKQGQVDWTCVGHITVNGVRKPLYCFVMVLGYSRAMYIEFTISMDQNTFLRCHINAFKFFGGIPQELLYDRLKTAVKSSDEQGKPVWNERFLDFAHYYGFTPRACRAYWPRTKGKVERPVSYIKGNFFAGVSFTTLEELNDKALAWLETKANRRVHGTTRAVPMERLLEEGPHLLALSGQPDYDTTPVLQRRVSSDCFVCVDTNRYSVPWRNIGQDVLVRLTEDELKVFWQGELIARHTRSSGRHQEAKHPAHFKGLKPGKPQRLTLLKAVSTAPVVEIRQCSYYEGVSDHA